MKNAVKVGSKPKEADEETLNRTDEEVAALNPILPGKNYWVSDPHTVWTQVQIVSQNGAEVIVKDALGKERKLDLHFEECHSCNPRVVDDMTSLHDMHEPGIMFNLEKAHYIINEMIMCGYIIETNKALILSKNFS